LIVKTTKNIKEIETKLLKKCKIWIRTFSNPNWRKSKTIKSVFIHWAVFVVKPNVLKNIVNVMLVELVVASFANA